MITILLLLVSLDTSPMLFLPEINYLTKITVLINMEELGKVLELLVSSLSCLSRAENVNQWYKECS